MVVGFAGGRFSVLARMPAAAEITTRIVATDLDGDGKPELLYGRADNVIVLIRP
jgi:hypothetical protein